MALEGSMEIRRWSEVESEFQGTGLLCANTWKCDKAQSIHGIALMYYSPKKTEGLRRIW